MRVILCLILVFVAGIGQTDQGSIAVKLESQDDKLVKKAEKLKAKIKTLRGLEFKKKPKVGSYTKDELREFLIKEIKTEIPNKIAVKQEKIGRTFGLFSKDFKFVDTFVNLLRENVAGFYHPRTKDLRLIANMEDMYILHELVHAAQDQHFDLRTLKTSDVANDDLAMALDSVIEGDASVAQWKFQLKDSFDLLKDQLASREGASKGMEDKYPRILKESLLLPYTDGYKFVLKAVEDKGWDAVNKMFDDPPLSTEQIFHPEKYFGKERDYPTEVKLPIIAINKELGKDHTRLGTNVWGEFGTHVIFSEYKLKSSVIRKASAGWDGDTYSVWERKDGRMIMVWYTTWDTGDDAQEFLDAYKKLVENKYSAGDSEKEVDGAFYYETKEQGRIALEKSDKDVLVIEGLDSKEELDAIRKILKEKTKKQEFKKFERAKLIYI